METRVQGRGLGFRGSRQGFVARARGRGFDNGFAELYYMPSHVATTTDDTVLWVQVEEWLKKTGSKDYVQAFKDHDMDGLALSGLLR